MARQMINSTNIAEQIVKPNENVLFVVDKIKPCNCNCNSCIIHETGSGQFTLKGEGIYRVLFKANITSEKTKEAIIDIETNGENVEEGKIIMPVAVDIYVAVMGFADIIVPRGTSKTVTIGNNSDEEVTFKNSNIEIKKIY